MTDERKDSEQSPPHDEGRGVIHIGLTPAERDEAERAREKEDEREYKKDQTSIQRGIFITQILLATFGIIGAVISYYQATTARQSAEQAKRAADLASDSFEATYGEKGIAERTMSQMVDQTVAQLKAAESAKSAAKTAIESLHVSERAYISHGAAMILWDKKAIYFPIENKGHIPSGPVHLVLHIGKNTKSPDGWIYTEYKWIERRMTRMEIGVPANFGGVQFEPEKLRSGDEWFQFGITIEYNDGFRNTPLVVEEDAVCGDYSKETGPVYGPCLATNAFELIKKADKYPNPENQIFR